MKRQSSQKSPSVVSIQSQLVYGCAGNNAAVPLLQRLGTKVYAVPTVLYSNTPHYESIAGAPTDPALLADLLARLTDRVAPTSIDAILTGFLNSVPLAAVIGDFIDRVRSRNPGVVVLVDPVMGDVDHGLIVPEDIVRSLREELVPRADILTPNVFEARLLSGRNESDPQELLPDILELGAERAAVTGAENTDGTSDPDIFSRRSPAMGR